MENTLATALRSAHERLGRQGLLAGQGASLSLRLPGEEAMLFLAAAGETQDRHEFGSACQGAPAAALHANIYRVRPDVGAILLGGGYFSCALAHFGGTLPTVFD